MLKCLTRKIYKSNISIVIILIDIAIQNFMPKKYLLIFLPRKFVSNKSFSIKKLKYIYKKKNANKSKNVISLIYFTRYYKSQVSENDFISNHRTLLPND